MTSGRATKKELREFGRVVGAAFTIVGLLLWWRHGVQPWVFFGITGFLVIFGLVAPEILRRVALVDPTKTKQLRKALDDLSEEGVIQVFYRSSVDRQNPYLGAVGMLQFEVLKERLKNEYSVTAVFEGLDFRYARWIQGNPEALAWLKASSSFTVVEDRNGSPVLLTDSEWGINYALQNAPKGLELFDIEPL